MIPIVVDRQHTPEYSIVVQRPGGRAARHLLPITETVRWSTAAIGGFGSCSFTCLYETLEQFPYLATVQLFDGDELLWEGRIEDRTIRLSGEERRVQVSCFGFQRLLQETSVRRIWYMRSIPWRASWRVGGLVAVGGDPIFLSTDRLFITLGQFDSNDLTRVGMDINNHPDAVTVGGEANWAVYVAPEGLTLTRFMGHATGVVGGARYFAQTSNDGATWSAIADGDTHGVDINVAISSARYLCVGGKAVSASNAVSWEDMRLLGSTLTEDASGGLYGGTVMRNLLALVPGLGIGDIESGNDFTIQSIARPVRDAVASVVGEIASYYTHEWRVWEGPSFEWKAVNFDEPQWIISFADCLDLELDSSVQGLTKTVYIVYENAATSEPEEQDAVSTDIRNPYVRTGGTAEEVLAAPVVMTSSSAQKLADRVATDHGNFPAVRGRVRVPANRLIQNARGTRLPASRIRGGENISIPELPSDDWIQQGRDGQTLFHVSAVDTDMEEGSTTVEFEGYSRRADVLLARLAAVTRTITGG